MDDIKKPYFSIIMPVYNGESTLKKSAESILKQSFENYELIIIDDKSVDHTAEIIYSLKKQYLQVNYLKGQGLGPGVARNRGMDYARGEYLLFIDSDDILFPESLERMSEKLKKEPTEILIFGFCLTNQLSHAEFHDYCPTTSWVKSARQVDFVSLYTNNLLNQVWNKAYKRSFIEKYKIRFAPWKYGEDRLFVIDCCMKAHNISTDNREFYNYILANKNSLVHIYHEEKFEVCSLIHQKVQKLVNMSIKKSTNTDIMKLNYMFIKSVFSCMVNICETKSLLSWKEKREKIFKITNSPQVQDAASNCKKINLEIWMLCFILRTKSITINYIFTICGIKIMNFLPNLTIKIKHKH